MNNNVKKQIIIIIFIIMIIFSCKKECPPFDQNLLSWLPSNDINDKFFFVNQFNDTLRLNVIDKKISDSYKDGCCTKCSCEANASFLARDSSYSKTIENSIWIDENNSITFNYIIYNINIGYFEFNFSEDIIIDTLTVNNKLYHDVIICEKDTNIHIDQEVWKIIIADNYGIIKFYNRVEGYEWVLCK